MKQRSGTIGLDALYDERFDHSELRRKTAIWKEICRGYLQRFVKPSDAVLDLACGTGEFINNIVAAKKLGVDLRSGARAHLDPDVEFMEGSATDLTEIQTGTLDVVFTSNFLEHLTSKSDVALTFREAHRVLRPGGRMIVMGPNIRYVSGAYWDFFDHHLALTEKSVAEGLCSCGFEIEKALSRFLPYSTKSALPQAP